MSYYTKPIRPIQLVNQEHEHDGRSSPTVFQEIEAQRLFMPQLQNQFNEEELRDLCRTLNIEYETLSGNHKTHRTLDLVIQLSRINRLPDLFAACAARRPDMPWPGDQ